MYRPKLEDLTHFVLPVAAAMAMSFNLQMKLLQSQNRSLR